MKPKIIKPGELFQLADTVYIYEVGEGKIVISKYSEAIKKDLSAEFNKLWQIHQKGNKKTALERFSVVVNRITPSELALKLKAYIQTNEFVYLKGLDVWLNPIKEHWNDPLVYKEGMKPVEDKPSSMSGMVMSLIFIILFSCTPVKKKEIKPTIKKSELIDAIESGSKLTKADAG